MDSFALFTAPDQGHLFSDRFGDGALFNRSAAGSSQYDNGLWQSPSRLTFSFVPDGTPVSDYWESSLFDSFSSLLSPQEIESTIGDAFQAWARQTGINFGFRPDSGDPAGISGLTQGDPRFGDIRVMAIPLEEQVYAVASPFELGVSGTWSGDIIFNSQATFQTVDEFYSVALHEIGHALGLEHSSHSEDVMFAGALNDVLTAGDVAALRAIYGTRDLDQYDTDGDNNDLLDDATRIRLAGSLKGEIPLLAFGDIHAASDVDFYELDLYSGYSGTVSFRLVSEGISQLAPAITVWDENGNPLAFRSSVATRGADLTVTVSPPGDSDTLFIKVEASGVLNRETGSYSLITLFDADVLYDPEVLEATMVQDLWNLKQSDVHTIFSQPTPLFNDDLHTNDTLESATALDPLASSGSESRFRVQAGIADSVDTDFYRLRVPASGTVLTATLTSLEQEGLVGEMKFYDEARVLLPTRVISNGNGQTLVQIDNVSGSGDIFVSVAAARPASVYGTGNYQLDLTFDSAARFNEVFAAGFVDTPRPQGRHALYVAETRLFNLGIEGSWLAGFGESALWLSVYGESGELVHRALTRPGEFRTSRSVVLQPGSYSVRVDFLPVSRRYDVLRTRDEERISYQILGTSVGDPIGPELIKSGRMRFVKCDPKTNEYCYPGGRRSEATFIFVSENGTDLPPDENPPPDYADVYDWFWYLNWQEQNG